MKGIILVKYLEGSSMGFYHVGGCVGGLISRYFKHFRIKIHCVADLFCACIFNN